jgi:cytochrome oxidase assembly protein ShyY1
VEPVEDVGQRPALPIRKEITEKRCDADRAFRKVALTGTLTCPDKTS